MRIDSIPWKPHAIDEKGTKLYEGDIVQVLRGQYKGKTGPIEELRLAINKKEECIDIKVSVDVSTSGFYFKTGWLHGDALRLLKRG